MILLGFHTFLIAVNRTTIENTEIRSILEGNEEKISAQTRLFLRELRSNQNFDSKTLSEKEKLLSVHNVGFLENFKQVFGDDFLFWFIPFK